MATRRSAGLGGKGLNQAVAAARAGADVIFHAAVGPGEAAGLTTALADEPRLTLRLVEGEAPTDSSLLLVQPDGENAIVSLCAAARGFDPVGQWRASARSPGATFSCCRATSPSPPPWPALRRAEAWAPGRC